MTMEQQELISPNGNARQENVNPLVNRKGYWSVSTDAEEGYSSRYLGVFYGNLEEVALYLADKSGYYLTMTMVNPFVDLVPTGEKAEVYVRIPGASSWPRNGEMSDLEAHAQLSHKYNGRDAWATKFPVKVDGAGGRLKITLTDKDTKVKMLKAKAMEKLNGVLSTEEMQLLGLVESRPSNALDVAEGAPPVFNVTNRIGRPV